MHERTRTLTRTSSNAQSWVQCVHSLVVAFTACTHIPTQVMWVRLRDHARTHAHEHTHAHIHTENARMHPHTHTCHVGGAEGPCTRAHTHTCTHTDTHTVIHTHTRTLGMLSSSKKCLNASRTGWCSFSLTCVERCREKSVV